MVDARSMTRAVMKYLGVVVILNAIVVSAIIYDPAGAQGSGVIETRSFELTQFDHVTLEGVGTARITKDKAPFLEMTTDENMFPLISVEVEGGNLIIKNEEEIRPSVFVMTIHSPNLRGISLTGNPTIEVPDISNNLFGISIKGNGSAEVSGEVDQLEVHVEGYGLVHAKELVAKEARVDIVGNGEVEVHATIKLAANCQGAGNVMYMGSPQLDGQCDGSVEPTE